MRVLTCTGMAAGSMALVLAMSGCARSNDVREDGRLSDNRTHEAEKSGSAQPSTNRSYEADNSGRNSEPSSALTPLDQGTSQGDVKITQQIRQALMDEDGFSVNAKNVKVITREGKVTLRGPVLGAAERSRIELIAERIAGTGNVTSELEYETTQN